MSTEKTPPCVLVLSAPSLPGTTLAAALGRNPGCYGVPEINLPLSATVDGFMREMSGPRVSQTHGVLRALGQLYGGEQTVHSIEMARRWLDLRGWMPTEAAFGEIAARIAPFRMVAPVTAMLYQPSAMKRLRSAFPDAAYVILRAHPRVFADLALGSEAGRIAVQLSGSVDEEFDPPLPDPQGLWLRTEVAATALTGGTVVDRGIFVGSTKGGAASVTASVVDFSQQLGRTIGGVSDIFCVAALATTNNDDAAATLTWQEHG